VEQDDKKGGRERNDRLFATPISASRMENMRSIFDLSERDRDELGHFFLTVTHFAKHNPKLLGWEGPEGVEALLRSSIR
jgi:inorganic pyrophosphatase